MHETNEMFSYISSKKWSHANFYILMHDFGWKQKPLNRMGYCHLMGMILFTTARYYRDTSHLHSINLPPFQWNEIPVCFRNHSSVKISPAISRGTWLGSNVGSMCSVLWSAPNTLQTCREVWLGRESLSIANSTCAQGAQQVWKSLW